MKHIVLPDAERRSLAFYLAMEEFVAGKYEDEAFFVWRVEPTVIIGRKKENASRDSSQLSPWRSSNFALKAAIFPDFSINCSNFATFRSSP